jgi:tRNA-Thr(GGU) m(6)t(6)A37 methyltransferase TsaA
LSSVVLAPIGVVRSPFIQAPGTPIQPTGAEETAGRIELDPPFAPGLKDLDGFSHIFVLYVFDRAGPTRLLITPYLDQEERGVFATRSPQRPNPIGLSLVRLKGCEGSTLHIDGVDILDGTPVLDIKPYIPQLNPTGEVRIGWLAGRTRGFVTARAP